MDERDDLNESLAERAFKEAVGAKARDADVFEGEFEGFVVLELEIVVVDAVVIEPESRLDRRAVVARA